MTAASTIPTTGHDDIDATIAGLIDLAAWRTKHPEISGGHLGDTFVIHRTTDHAAIVRAITDGARIGEVEKYEVNNGETIHVTRRFAGDVKIVFAAKRDQVCTRRVTGTETVQVRDPDAPLITVEREIVEWVCAPILAGS